MPFECPQDVANDYESLLTNTNIVEYDVIIYAGNNNREIYAHSLVLRTRSQYFRTEFSNGSFDRRNGKFIFNLPNITSQLFNMILRFIYCGKINLDQLDESDVLNLLMAADEINIQRLIDYIQGYLIENRGYYLQQNFIEILEKIYQNNAFIDLQNICIRKICVNPERLLNSNDFTSLNASLLELIFNRDDLPLDEIVVWDNLIRWCLAQHPSIPQDPTQWNNDEITNMERTIHRFVPLVRFCHISPENFATRVYPFREIMPNNLVNSMVQFHMTQNQQFNNDRRPPRKLANNSVIVELQHFAIFSSWIEMNDASYYNERNIPYKFNLLYRSNRDGNTPDAFHDKCDNKGATIVILKIPNSEQILGGYNPLQWDSSNTEKHTRESFLFSFKNRNNLNSATVGRNNANDSFIQCYQIYGPAFGSSGRFDLFQDSDGDWKSYLTHPYSNINIPKGYGSYYNIFNVENYEVFQVVRI
ncbi:BTB/POZ domain-containing protein [Rhizophagus irregularis DAOM 181602=DAOM 197198]|uniref:Kelch-like protein 17 n=3 Tax=Rhizophagus irregularis TaxID=588596 RepID=A0A015JPQ8_RHIIW|nr:hypothetical protein GLOIN_2v1769259 [Rhizophagus irregularis DAOM 181602=DAOM 197198]EXX56989.1 hypothetical protein RirG_211300 [Rhizophagus irregularis DAOM 197198w]POG76239.1 hypothetical protein GLOIN_2v1769259 [Rhizophagus irregularis DAOM 181602=DAOM 197198]GBC17615.1 BTB/POZ domain-containing protein [Rhizophagus irregularis DAOM 181602=DAOM 197198]|eukprot:XP_025183105.1 hypothetical protein GLOIN_2v1769259 [Rhizophagus irregularis DAOM 181602=DAOM 197198]